MKKRATRFDDGGMASSGPQSAFDQPSSASGGVGFSNNVPLVQIGSDTGTGVGGVQTSPQASGPLNIGPPTQQMRKGGAVKSRGDGCAQRGKTRGTMR